MAPTIQKEMDAGRAAAASTETTTAARMASRQLSAETVSRVGVVRAVPVPDRAGKIDISKGRSTWHAIE